MNGTYRTYKTYKSYSYRANCKSMYGILGLQCGSVPRAVASASQPEARSLPLAVLIQSAYPYMQLQSALSYILFRLLKQISLATNEREWPRISHWASTSFPFVTTRDEKCFLRSTRFTRMTNPIGKALE